MLRPPHPASLLANLRRAWRRSLELRVITITVASTGVLVMIFGLVVGKLITDGLVNTRETAAKEVVLRSSGDAGRRLESQVSGPRDPLGTFTIGNVVRTLSKADGVNLAILPESSADGLTVANPPPVPESLREAVRKQEF